MSDPLTFDSATPRFGLPLLFAGQAQKEFYVNEAHALADALLHCAVEDVSETPPSSPNEGSTWLIGPAPTGSWTGQAGKLACRQLSNWLFVTPRDGLSVLNRATGQVLRHHGGWIAPSAPPAPGGGTTIDNEARATLATLLDALVAAGIFATS